MYVERSADVTLDECVHKPERTLESNDAPLDQIASNYSNVTEESTSFAATWEKDDAPTAQEAEEIVPEPITGVMLDPSNDFMAFGSKLKKTKTGRKLTALY
ncbi:hypothetical protein LTR49_027280 [Elasticomyces elasticus]|nr:hypothetical protein LTR49_027280 [Elasticomyces elasticus]KAK5710534.1 hypothetical protein LTS12_027987 [Elasticomyces elasticus]